MKFTMPYREYVASRQGELAAPRTMVPYNARTALDRKTEALPGMKSLLDAKQAADDEIVYSKEKLKEATVNPRQTDVVKIAELEAEIKIQQERIDQLKAILREAEASKPRDYEIVFVDLVGATMNHRYPDIVMGIQGTIRRNLVERLLTRVELVTKM
jgi:hypothetical protein